jgi:hypothetical protein
LANVPALRDRVGLSGMRGRQDRASAGAKSFAEIGNEGDWSESVIS